MRVKGLGSTATHRVVSERPVRPESFLNIRRVKGLDCEALEEKSRQTVGNGPVFFFSLKNEDLSCHTVSRYSLTHGPDQLDS